jgi:hypothetical protein
MAEGVNEIENMEMLEKIFYAWRSVVESNDNIKA